MCHSSATEPVCGTEYLFSTLGAQLELTRPACFSASAVDSNTFFLVSPTPVTTVPITSSTSGEYTERLASPSNCQANATQRARVVLLQLLKLDQHHHHR
jgi:hypothetical protein